MTTTKGIPSLLNRLQGQVKEPEGLALTGSWTPSPGGCLTKQRSKVHCQRCSRTILLPVKPVGRCGCRVDKRTVGSFLKVLFFGGTSPVRAISAELERVAIFLIVQCVPVDPHVAPILVAVVFVAGDSVQLDVLVPRDSLFSCRRRVQNRALVPKARRISCWWQRLLRQQLRSFGRRLRWARRL